jgi:hypothetical protein
MVAAASLGVAHLVPLPFLLMKIGLEHKALRLWGNVTLC